MLYYIIYILYYIIVLYWYLHFMTLVTKYIYINYIIFIYININYIILNLLYLNHEFMQQCRTCFPESQTLKYLTPINDTHQPINQSSHVGASPSDRWAPRPIDFTTSVMSRFRSPTCMFHGDPEANSADQTLNSKLQLGTSLLNK